MAAQSLGNKTPLQNNTPPPVQRDPQPVPQPTQQTPPLPPNQPPSKKTWSPTVSIISIILTSLLVFFGGLFYLQYLQNQNIEDKEKIEQEEKKNEAEKLKLIEANAKSDSTRKLNITSVKKGIEKYRIEKKKYPEKLEQLTPDYLTVIPLDPVTKNTYDYIPAKNLSSYTLSATLSDDSSFTVENDTTISN